MVEAIKAYGTTLARAGNTIAELTGINGPAMSADTIEVTHHQSENGFREYIQGLKDGGEISLEGSFIPGDTNGQVGLISDFNEGNSQTFVITFPGNIATWSFSGIVTKIENQAPFDGKLAFNAAVKITGKPTLGISISDGLTTPYFAISESAVITPVPTGDKYTYVATVLNGITSVTVTPTALTGVITINGNVVATGIASSAITLGAAGSVTVITIVVTETGKAPKTYTIYLSRAS
ncbi:phage tail tube protein [Dehalococcoides mccartyi]|jgi:hypothetical protein|uniref:phage tail tube protein n=1 Tax=Dehalococcoides mccartyi TaxID=61435 RepID=UPI00098F6F05|nr:phage tail tube protein [Dehalococcoides mccartyi]AQU06107.1 hypothetical protein B1777_05330 [Dehalococcoides mccartyi]AQU07550.1 hypothetical protein B1778_05130 [Dehalococcoides mccartyi]AQX74796.1 hypothetical protein B1776_04425 [Dehalococcoides mccartyi]AQY73373.1 hypothetical protein B1772_04735 [Dehalococcoides mccartyi]QBX64073.1 hypothetical protein DhcFL2_04760 [Dehalococcoides mccartyi]